MMMVKILKNCYNQKSNCNFKKKNFFKHIFYNYEQFAKSNNIKIDYNTNDKIRGYINRLFDKFAQQISNKDLETEKKRKNKNIANFKKIVPKIITEN